MVDIKVSKFFLLNVTSRSSQFTAEIVNNFILANWTTIKFIIFWDFLMVEQIFLSPQVKRNVIICNKLVYMSCLTSCRCLVLPQNKNFVSTSKNLLKNRNWTFPVVRYFTWKLEFVSNILWMIVASSNRITYLRPVDKTLPARLRNISAWEIRCQNIVTPVF